jgi:RND family efflux transporter MFP subunit
VTTVVARKDALAQTLDLTGGVAGFKEVTVYSKVTGVIEKLLVERGMGVKKGDVIAVVEHKTEMAQREELVTAAEAARVAIRQAEAAVEVAEAAQQQAEAQLENAALEKGRVENLYKENSVPKQKYDAVMAQYKVALAGRDLAAANLRAGQEAVAQAKVGLTQARAALERLDVRIAEYTIGAPISGVVTARFVDGGAMDNPALPIVQIMDTSTLKVNCDVAQVNAGRVRKAQAVAITTDAYPDTMFEGIIKIVNPSLDSKTRTLPVEIHTTGKRTSDSAETSTLLKPGMFVKVGIDLGTKTGIVVPRDCLMRLPGTGVYHLFTVKDGKAEKGAVELGVSRGNLVEVIHGVREGDRVVIKGQVNLKTGTPVVGGGPRGHQGPGEPEDRHARRRGRMMNEDL